MANLMAGENLYRSLEVFQSFFVLQGCTELPLGYIATDEDIVSSIKRFSVTTLCGFASRIVALGQFFFVCPYPFFENVFLASFVHQNKIEISTITTIIHGGEIFTERKKRFVRSVFGKNVRIHGVYGSSECGVFSVTDGGDDDVYHYCCDGVQVDIEEGRVIVSNLLRTKFAITRYDSQDMAERTGVASFRLLGRSEGSHKFPLGDFNLDFNVLTSSVLSNIEKACSGLIVSQIHILSDSINHKDRIKLVLFTSDNVEKSLIDEAAKRLQSSLDDSVSTELYIAKSLQELHKSKRSSKLLFFVDLR